MRELEASLQASNKIQAQLLELVDDLRRGLEQYPADGATGGTDTLAMEAVEQADGLSQYRDRQAHYNRYRDMQLQRLVDAGLNADRAEFVLGKQERFQYEHMMRTYEYRHMDDKSSVEARAMQRELSLYSHPRKILEQELSEQEFEAYLKANGGGQEMRISNVISDAPASTAGLRPGDKIISYNGERVFHMGDLRNQIYRVEPGKTVTVEVQRAGSSSKEIIYIPSGPLGVQG